MQSHLLPIDVQFACYNERDGVVHDFTRKGGDEHCEIVLPHGMYADWALDRSALWNAAEHSENRKDSRVAREFEIALPMSYRSKDGSKLPAFLLNMSQTALGRQWILRSTRRMSKAISGTTMRKS